MRRIQIFTTLTFALFVFGCAQTALFTPVFSNSHVVLSNLPQNLIAVDVRDFRPNSNDDFVSILKEQVTSALGAAFNTSDETKYTIKIDIIEHRSYFTLGNWNASTALNVKLYNATDEIIYQFEIHADAHRSNMFGYKTARDVSQDSYDSAVSQLFSRLSSVSLDLE